jgi:putative FmdB family regulatory protein
VPTYQYACTECGEQVEAVQKFTDDPLTVCEACGGKLRKVFFPAGIVFKGSGFYRTDSRNGSKTPSVAAKDKQTIDAASSGSSGSADSKPAAKSETAGSSSSSATPGSSKSSAGEKAA